MTDKANALDRIVLGAIQALIDRGLADLTVGSVAEVSGVSTALIHYHFDTKQRLLAAAAERILSERAAGRLRALTLGVGIEALDRLWELLRSEAADGRARACFELLVLARDDPGIRGEIARHRARERAGLVTRIPALFAELGARPLASAEECALLLMATLDGLAMALHLGTTVDAVKAAYDACWLSLVAAGQGARS